MPILKNKNLLLISLTSLIFSMQLVTAPHTRAANAPGAIGQQEFQNYMTQLKNQRDAEIAALVKQRNDKIQALVDGLKQLMQQGLAQINQDKLNIQKRMQQGQNMSQAQSMLLQQEKALQQKSQLIQQQIESIKVLYEKEIRNLGQAYAQKFSTLQQQYSAQK